MTLGQDLLAAFEAVARLGTVGKAAVSLHSTQPTVSRQIRSLERYLGQPLFERDSAGMHLTAAGRDFAPRARLILHELQLARDTLDAHGGLKRGAIRVGGVTTLVRTFLPPILAEVARRAPQLKIEAVVGSEEQLDRALAQRELDLIFATQPPGEVEAVEIGSGRYSDRCVVFCAADHAFARQQRPEIAGILQQQWALGHPGATTRQQFEKLVVAAGHRFPSVALQTDSVDLIISVVAQSAILGWLPEPLLQHPGEKQRIRVLSVPELELIRNFSAYRRSRGTFPPGGQVFIDAMAAAGA